MQLNSYPMLKANVRKTAPPTDPRLDRQITDAQWAVIGPLLQTATGQKRQSHRLFINASLSVLNTGCSWRDLDPSYGGWNTNYVKFRRWAAGGIWDQLLPAFVALGLTASWKVPFEESEGFPTTVRIMVEHARRMSKGEVVDGTIAAKIVH
jgi:transposase